MSDRLQSVVGNVKAYVHLVGQEFFYTKYDVMVQPYNDAGPGPNSSVVQIYSAEDRKTLSVCLPVFLPVCLSLSLSVASMTGEPTENESTIQHGLDAYVTCDLYRLFTGLFTSKTLRCGKLRLACRKRVNYMVLRISPSPLMERLINSVA